MDRRQFIQTSIVTASGMTLAGCLGGEGDGSEANGTDETGAEFPAYDLPGYSAWPPNEPRTNDFVLFGHLSIEHLHGADNEEEGEPDEAPTAEDDEDVLLTLPGYGFMITAFWFQLGLWGYPWEGPPCPQPVPLERRVAGRGRWQRVVLIIPLVYQYSVYRMLLLR